MSEQGIPSIDELFERFRLLLSDKEFTHQSISFMRYFKLVASGGSPPILSDSNAVMAAQCVVIVAEHVLRQMEAEKAGAS